VHVKGISDLKSFSLVLQNFSFIWPCHIASAFFISLSISHCCIKGIQRNQKFTKNSITWKYCQPKGLVILFFLSRRIEPSTGENLLFITFISDKETQSIWWERMCFAANWVKIRAFWEDLLRKIKTTLIWKHSANGV